MVVVLRQENVRVFVPTSFEGFITNLWYAGINASCCQKCRLGFALYSDTPCSKCRIFLLTYE
jgi:hypothetical protein